MLRRAPVPGRRSAAAIAVWVGLAAACAGPGRGSGDEPTAGAEVEEPRPAATAGTPAPEGAEPIAVVGIGAAGAEGTDAAVSGAEVDEAGVAVSVGRVEVDDTGGAVSVLGVVLDETGAPVAGVEVEAVTYDAEEERAHHALTGKWIDEIVLSIAFGWFGARSEPAVSVAYTDRDGRFALDGVEPGLLYVWATWKRGAADARWGGVVVEAGSRVALELRLRARVRPFDRAAWRAAGQNGHRVPYGRQAMLEEVCDELLPGRSRDEVRELLGPSDWDADDGPWHGFPRGSWAWWLHPTFADDSWLVVLFDEQDRVVGTERYND